MSTSPGFLLLLPLPGFAGQLEGHHIQMLSLWTPPAPPSHVLCKDFWEQRGQDGALLHFAERNCLDSWLHQLLVAGNKGVLDPDCFSSTGREGTMVFYGAGENQGKNRRERLPGAPPKGHHPAPAPDSPLSDPENKPDRRHAADPSSSIRLPGQLC